MKYLIIRLLFAFCVFSSFKNQYIQILNEFCTLTNETQLNCANFTNFSQLNFSNLLKGNVLSSLELNPSDPIELNESDLDLNGLDRNLDNTTLVKLKNIDGFSISYSNLNIFENLTLCLDDSNFKFRPNNNTINSFTLFSLFNEINFGENNKYEEFLDPILFNNSKKLKIDINKNWFQIDSKAQDGINSNIKELKFIDCNNLELNESVLNPIAYSNLNNLLVFNKLHLLNSDAINKLSNLEYLEIRIENLKEFISKTRLLELNNSKLQVKFDDKGYDFSDSGYCFFDHLNRTGIQFKIEVNQPIENLTCTLLLLDELKLINLTNKENIDKSYCDKIALNCSNNSFTNSPEITATSPPINALYSILAYQIYSGAISVALLLSIIILVIIWCKYRKLKLYKSDVAYELEPTDDKFE